MPESESQDLGAALLSQLCGSHFHGFGVLDAQSRLESLSPALVELLTLPLADLKNRRFSELLTPSSRADFSAIFCGLHPGEEATRDLEFVTGGGAVRRLRVCFFPQKEGGAARTFFLAGEPAPDAAERDLTRLQLQALAAAANAVVITARDGTILWVNRAFSRVTGYTHDEAVGGNPTLLRSGRHGPEFYREMWETVLRGEVWHGEITNRRKNGTFYTEDMTITPLFDAGGTITHFIAVKQDISEQKELEERFLRAQRLESIGTLASGVAHDLNNVLSPIVMSADLLLVQQEDPHVAEMLQMIKESAKRGADIVRQLLGFARGESGEVVEVQLRHLLKKSVKVFRETFPKNIQIEDRISPDLFTVNGDATQLHQVIANLMINARDAMPEGGDLLLHAENFIADPAWVESHPGGRLGYFIRIRVQDNGIGMSPEVKDRIFESFFTTKDRGKGTGLGLSTTLNILKTHKGFVLVDSQPGKGSTFDVYLPVSSEIRSSLSLEDETPLPGEGERLLVIDDEESICFMLRGTLTTLGYEVEIAHGGEEGLRKLIELAPELDLILLDMMMPVVDGAAVVREMKARNLRIPVLIMSGMVPEEKLLETGVDLEKSFIAKPFTILDLARMLRINLRK